MSADTSSTGLIDDPVAEALGYPYPPAEQPLLFAGTHAATPLQRLGTGDVEGRTPVIACGSNRSPLRLARKFRDMPGRAIPMAPCVLPGWDSVYAAHIAAYGSVPATLAPSPATRVHLTLLWLNAEELARMDATEGLGRDYDRLSLPTPGLRTTLGPAPDRVEAYQLRAGPLVLDGQPAALAEIHAEGRRLPALAQSEVQAELCRRLGDVGEVGEAIRRVRADPNWRRVREKALQKPGGL